MGASRSSAVQRQHRRVVGIVFALVLPVLSLLATADAAAAMHDHHLGARMHGTPHYPYALGHADYEGRSGHRQFDIHMWNMGRLHGKTLVVFANGQVLGTFRVGTDGRCRMHRDTGSGQSVPTLSSGDPVAVKTRGGALVASGTLRRMMMTM